MNIVPRRVIVPIATVALVLCAAVAPLQWAQGNTARAVFLGVLALTSLWGLVSALRRPADSPATAPASAATSPIPQPSPSPTASGTSTPAEDPRWRVETLSDQLPDPADRRTARRWFIAFAALCLAGVIACCVATGISGDLTFMGFAVLLAIPVLVITYGVARNGFDL